MNERFVNIKVDREERPDLDSIYMEAVQAMTGHGGWPMSVFLTPEGQPFYGGTYYPPEPRYGMPGFGQVVIAVSDAYQNRRTDIEGQAQRLTDALQPVRHVGKQRKRLGHGDPRPRPFSSCNTISTKRMAALAISPSSPSP